MSSLLFILLPQTSIPPWAMPKSQRLKEAEANPLTLTSAEPETNHLSTPVSGDPADIVPSVDDTAPGVSSGAKGDDIMQDASQDHSTGGSPLFTCAELDRNHLLHLFVPSSYMSIPFSCFLVCHSPSTTYALPMRFLVWVTLWYSDYLITSAWCRMILFVFDIFTTILVLD